MSYEILSPGRGLVEVSDMPDTFFPHPVTKDFRQRTKGEPQGLPYPVLGELGTDFQDALYDLVAFHKPPGESNALSKVGQARPDFYQPLMAARTEAVHQAAGLIKPEDNEFTSFYYSEVAIEPGKKQRESIVRSHDMLGQGWISMEEVFPYIVMLAADSVNTNSVLPNDESQLAEDMRMLAATPFHVDPNGGLPSYLPGRLDILEVKVQDVDDHSLLLVEALGKAFQGNGKRARLLDVRKLNETDVTVGNKSFSSLEVLQEAFRQTESGNIELTFIEVKSALNTYQKDRHDLGKELGAYLLSGMRLAENVLPELAVPERMDNLLRRIGASAIIMGCKIVPSQIDIPGHPFVDELVTPSNIYAQRFDFSQPEKDAYMRFRDQKVQSHLSQQKASGLMPVAA